MSLCLHAECIDNDGAYRKHGGKFVTDPMKLAKALLGR